MEEKKKQHTGAAGGLLFSGLSPALRLSRLVNPEDIEDVRREIRVMHHLSGHPHVVTFKGVYEDASHVHIVMELCTGGEVGERLAAASAFWWERFLAIS